VLFRAATTIAAPTEGSVAEQRRAVAGRWLPAALWTTLALSALPYTPALRAALVKRGVRAGPLVAFAVLFAAGALAWGVVSAWRTPRRWRAVAVATSAAVVYAALIDDLTTVPIEVTHVVEYGVLGLLVWHALGWRGGGAPWLAVAAAGAVGVVDELTQAVTPGRFCDPRDIAANFVSAALPVWVVASGRAKKSDSMRE
jgi:VanZ family protein